MWKFLNSVSSAAFRYTTVLGKIWYVIVFVLRLLVIVSFGENVYGDERGVFKCQITNADGCENMCFDQFVRINHIRFWTLQLLVVAGPTAFFHLYCTQVENDYKYVQTEKKKLKSRSHKLTSGEVKKLRSKERKLGKVHLRRTQHEGKQIEVPLTKKVEIVYIITLLIRMVAEVAFIYFGFRIFNVKNGYRDPDSGISNFLWMSVPSVFNCKYLKKSDDVYNACYHHTVASSINSTGSVPCWVSRSKEKTTILRFMNIVGVICLFVTIAEFIISLYRYFSKTNSKKIAAENGNMVESDDK